MGNEGAQQRGRAEKTFDNALNDFETRVEKLWKYHRKYKQVNLWALHVLGIGAALFAGAAAVAALEEWSPGRVAIFAAIAGALGGIQPFLRPGERTAFHLTKEVAYDEILSKVKQLRRSFEFDSLPRVEAESEFTAVQTEFFEERRRGVEELLGLEPRRPIRADNAQRER